MFSGDNAALLVWTWSLSRAQPVAGRGYTGPTGICGWHAFLGSPLIVWSFGQGKLEHLTLALTSAKSAPGQSIMPTDLVSLPKLDQADYLYHLGITSEGAKEKYGDVKFVCCGGSAKRMTAFANDLAKDFGLGPVQPSGKTDRYTWFKVGPVIVSSHGMGMPSISILLHEVAKLLKYAEAKDVCFFRLGSSGGIGVPPGTVVLTTEAMDGEIKPQFTLPILGKMVTRPTKIDVSLVDELEACAGNEGDIISVTRGRTMATDCFYEGQGRLDGAICDYTEADKLAFLAKLNEAGVKNIEMEAGVFAAFTQRLGIRGAVCCVTLLDRLKGDQVVTSPEDLADFDTRPGRLLRKFIKSKIA